MHPDDNEEITIYCITLSDSGYGLKVVPEHEVQAGQRVGRQTFTDEAEAHQQARIIEALSSYLSKADQLRAAAWLLDNRLLSK